MVPEAERCRSRAPLGAELSDGVLPRFVLVARRPVRVLAACPCLEVVFLVLFFLWMLDLGWSFLLLVYSKVLPLVQADLLVHGSLVRLVLVWGLRMAVDSWLLLLRPAPRPRVVLVSLLLVFLRRLVLTLLPPLPRLLLWEWTSWR